MKELKILLASMSILALALITGAPAGPAFAADDGMGMVLAIDGSAEAIRGGNRTKLAPKDRLFALDTLATGTDSKLQILLDDDTSITMGSESTLEMREFSNEPDDSRFSSHLAHGRMRIITGETTERNPDGFKLTTRHATIGIRGTVLSVETNENFTGVGVDNTNKTTLVNGTPVPQFHKAVVFDGGEPEITPRTPGERESDGWLATGPGGPVEGGGGDDTLTAGGFENGAPGGFGFADDAPRAASQTSMKGHASAAVELSIPATTMPFTSVNVLGDIGFDVDIESGRISDGTANLSYTASYSISDYPPGTMSIADLSSRGGSGLADVNGNFDIGGFSGTLTFLNNSSEYVPTDGGELSVWGSGLFSGEPFELWFGYLNNSGEFTSTWYANYINTSENGPIYGNLNLTPSELTVAE